MTDRGDVVMFLGQPLPDELDGRGAELFAAVGAALRDTGRFRQIATARERAMGRAGIELSLSAVGVTGFAPTPMPGTRVVLRRLTPDGVSEEEYAEEVIGPATAVIRSARVLAYAFAQPEDYAQLLRSKGIADEAIHPGRAAGQGPRRPISFRGRRRIYSILCNLAVSDGSVHPRERGVLDRVAKEFEIGPAEAASLARDAMADAAQLNLGKAPEEQSFLIEVMLELAAADGRLAPAEAKRLIRFADVIGVSRDELRLRFDQHLSDAEERAFVAQLDPADVATLRDETLQQVRERTAREEESGAGRAPRAAGRPRSGTERQAQGPEGPGESEDSSRRPTQRL